MTWSVSNGLTLTNGQGTGNITVSDNGCDDFGIITINIDSGCGNLTFSRVVSVGVPDTPTTSPSGVPTIQMCLGESLSVFISNSDSGTPNNNITWTANGSLTESFQCTGVNCVFEALSLGAGNFRVSLGNQCGNTVEKVGAVNVSQCNGGGGMFRVTPNPTKGIIQVDLPNDVFIENKQKVVTIMDRYSNQIFEREIYNNSLSFNLGRLENGFYYVNVFYEGRTFSATVLKI